jgi:predicted RNase H-like HicB family nuclease
MATVKNSLRRGNPMSKTETQQLYEELQAIRSELSDMSNQVKWIREHIQESPTSESLYHRSRYLLPVLLEADETGGYVVTSPILPGLVTEGDDSQEAVQHAKDAAESLLESMIEDGDTLPAELSGYQPGDELSIFAVSSVIEAA